MKGSYDNNNNKTDNDMGMFDSLKINTDKLPLTEEERKQLGNNPNWQTKDFECILSTGEITDEGKLKFLTFKYKWDDEATSGLYALTGYKGGLVPVDEEWLDYPNYHGYISFYNENFYFKAKFTDGQLIEIIRCYKHTD